MVYAVKCSHKENHRAEGAYCMTKGGHDHDLAGSVYSLSSSDRHSGHHLPDRTVRRQCAVPHVLDPQADLEGPGGCGHAVLQRVRADGFPGGIGT